MLENFLDIEYSKFVYITNLEIVNFCNCFLLDFKLLKYKEIISIYYINCKFICLPLQSSCHVNFFVC